MMRSKSSQEIMDYLDNKGPIIVRLYRPLLIDAALNRLSQACVEASSPVWQLYKKGVIRAADSPYTMVNHAIVIVGYGTLENFPVWILRNHCTADSPLRSAL